LSLLEGAPRPTLTVRMELDPEGDVLSVEVHPSRLTSSRRLEYDEADALMRDPASDSLSSMLRAASRLAARLLKRRQQRGALALFDLERGVATSEDGLIRRLEDPYRYHSHLLIQELMILTNQVVAERMARNGVPILFRNHAARAIAPGRDKLVAELANTLASPETFPLETLEERLQLVLERARYDPRLEGHFALNLPAYAHFTSPIRRYADLVNQRVVTAALAGQPCPYSFDELDELAGQVNEAYARYREHRAMVLKQKAKLRRPSYTYGCSRDGDHTCTCTLRNGARTFTGVGHGSRKPIAKQAAARSVLDQLDEV
ncbi:MAG: RNB domain-containing ribonuclease, partial [Candidatus Eremiobacterota bacterium]